MQTFTKMPKIAHNDEMLWDALRSGDKKAFAVIYESYAQMLYSYSTNFTPDRDLIKDCLHDLFVEIWKNHATLGKTTSIKFYLMASIKRKVVRHLEQGIRQQGLKEDYLLENPSTTPSHERALIHAEEESYLNKTMQKAFTQLTKRQREAINMRFFQDLETEEISRLMGINAQSVYNLIFGALKVLKGEMSYC